MSLFTILWIVWIAAFFVIEAVAIFNDIKEDTLSEHFRNWFRVDTKIGRSIWLVFSGGFIVWFIPHILLGIV